MPSLFCLLIKTAWQASEAEGEEKKRARGATENRARENDPPLFSE